MNEISRCEPETTSKSKPDREDLLGVKLAKTTKTLPVVNLLENIAAIVAIEKGDFVFLVNLFITTLQATTIWETFNFFSFYSYLKNNLSFTIGVNPYKSNYMIKTFSYFL